MTREERTTKLKAYITCLKCQIKGHACNVHCPTMYEVGNMGEIVENLEWISETFKQEPTEWEKDHEILKAYSDGANEVLDKIRPQIWDLQYGDKEKSMTNENRADVYNNAITQVIDIIDKYKTEIEV